MTTSYKNFFLNEAIDNLFIRDKDERNIYVDRVWDILQASYSYVGGIKGNGFRSKEEMVRKIPFWKIARRGEDVKVVMMYKDKELSGRKLIAIGTDGSNESKAMLASMIADEAKTGRSWNEVSDAALRFSKHVLGDKFEDYLIPYSEVIIYLADDFAEGRIKPVAGSDYEYQHKFGSTWVTKVALGVAGNKIY